MIKVNDKWFRFGAVTFLWLMAIYSNKLYAQPPSWTLAGRILLIPASIALTWQGNRFIILYFREKFSGRYELTSRIAVVFSAGMFFTWFMLVCTAFVSNLILYGAKGALAEIQNGQLFHAPLTYMLFLQFALFFGIYEALYYYARLKHTEAEK
jgi:hypothetical protein